MKTRKKKKNHENSLFRQIFKTANKNSLKVVNDKKKTNRNENKTKRKRRLTLFSTNNQ